MLTTIHIAVCDRVPIITAGEDVISHNSDYVAEFVFDEEWQDKVKTVYYVCEDGSYHAVVMSGNSCDVPMMAGEHRRIFVGVQEGTSVKPGKLKTTRPCCLKVKDSIADLLGQPIPDPTPDVYEQIIAMLNNLTTPTWNAVQNKPFESLGDGLSVEDGVLSAKGGTGGSANAVQYVAQELTDAQKAQARENIGAGTSSFSGSYNDLTSKPTIPTQVTIDSTLKQSGQAADAKAVGDALQHFTPTEALNSEFRAIELTFATKLDKNQGAENAGKILGIGEDGNVIPQDKPTYTAEEVGALPNTTVIPTVPATLPNPQKLTFTGAVTGEYDGSSALTVDIPQGGDSLVIPEQRIALDNAMLVGPVTHVGTVIETNTDYRHTEKIKLNSHKSFQLTGKDASGNVIHIALRYVTAYDAEDKVISAYSLQNVAEASASTGRVVQMDTAVDSVIVSIYKPEQYTDKTFILPSVVRDVASVLAEKITAPTTAAVGQIIKVKSVDTSGKPTEWEAADLPSGGEGTWTKIHEETLAEAVSSYVYPLDNVKAAAIVVFPGASVNGWKKITIGSKIIPVFNAAIDVNDAVYAIADVNEIIKFASGKCRSVKLTTYGTIGTYYLPSTTLDGLTEINQIGTTTAGLLVAGAKIEIYIKG